MFGFLDIILRSITKTSKVWPCLSPSRFSGWHARWSLCGFSILIIQSNFQKKNKELHEEILRGTLEHVMSLIYFVAFQGSTGPQNLTSPTYLGIPNGSSRACHTATLWSTTLRFLSERLNCKEENRIRFASHCWILLEKIGLQSLFVLISVCSF